MTKKHFIELADMLRRNRPDYHSAGVTPYHEGFQNGRSSEWETIRDQLADFCQSQNPQFNRERWLDYIAGRCGSNGGAIKLPRTTSLAQQEHEESGCTDYLQHNAENCPLLLLK